MRRVRTAFTSCLFMALLIGGGDPGCSSDSNLQGKLPVILLVLSHRTLDTRGAASRRHG